MTILYNIRLLLSWTLISASLLSAADLSQYRHFRLDSDLKGLAKQAEVDPSEVKTIHEYPAAIQELSWRGESEDSVRGILFSFYNTELFRMVVDYDRYNTEGLTADDMIDALSTKLRNGSPFLRRDHCAFRSRRRGNCWGHSAMGRCELVVQSRPIQVRNDVLARRALQESSRAGACGRERGGTARETRSSTAREGATAPCR